MAERFVVSENAAGARAEVELIHVGSLPHAMLRGLRVQKWILEDGTISHEAFMPAAGTLERRKLESRVPFGHEVSINWEDNENAMVLTLKAATAQHGAVRLSRSTLEIINDLAGDDVIAWERQPVDGNPYHGNIVFLERFQKPRQRAVATTLALAAKLVEKKHR